MRLEYEIPAAVLLDLLIGDPRGFPHPVRGIGWLAARLEGVTRSLLPPRLAGAATALLTVAVASGAAWALVAYARSWNPWAGAAASVCVIWTTIAPRDLAAHARRVRQALESRDLPEARRRVGWMVGRDTDTLDESGVTRAAVESVAEGTVDGVTAPLFFALLFGPAGAVAYRAINTLDSTFGYRNEKYTRFGWASARLDDAANWIPARLTALALVAVALCRGRGRAAWTTLRRDGRKHPSPNAGLPEAAMAGALGTLLGGASHYGGVPSEKPRLGVPERPLEPRDIARANALMLAASGVFLVIGLAARLAALVALSEGGVP